MAKYHLHDTVLRGLLTSWSWVIYYKQLNAREAASLHRRHAPALLLKRRSHSGESFTRLRDYFRKKRGRPLTMICRLEWFPSCACIYADDIGFSSSNIVAVVHFRPDRWLGWRNVYRHRGHWSHHCVIIHPCHIVRITAPSSTDFLGMIKRVVARSRISLRKLHISAICSIALTSLWRVCWIWCIIKTSVYIHCEVNYGFASICA